MYTNCHVCGRPMAHVTTSELYLYKGHRFHISNICAHKCHWCDEYVYTSDTAKLIEDVVKNAVGDKEE